MALLLTQDFQVQLPGTQPKKTPDIPEPQKPHFYLLFHFDWLAFFFFSSQVKYQYISILFNDVCEWGRHRETLALKKASAGYQATETGVSVPVPIRTFITIETVCSGDTNKNLLSL